MGYKINLASRAFFGGSDKIYTVSKSDLLAIDKFSKKDFYHRTGIKRNGLLEKYISAMDVSLVCTLAGFLCLCYIVFIDSSKVFLFYSAIGVWCLGIAWGLLSLASYGFEYHKSQNKSGLVNLASFIDSIVKKQNDMTDKTGTTWRRGYQSLWIEIERKEGWRRESAYQEEKEWEIEEENDQD